MILVTGATGFLGKRVCRMLESRQLRYLPTALSSGVDLRERSAAMALFERRKPQFVINCAALVGGIQFGLKRQADLLRDNLLISLNLLEASASHGVARVINPISNCAYPGDLTLFKESDFWKGPLHQTVLAYGFARKASWVGSWAFSKQYGLDSINLILSNMYGPEDHFDEERSHALGALIMKIVNAHFQGLPSVSVWGSGNPVREWLHVDDGAEAMVRALDIKPFLDPINIGLGKGISIRDLALMISSMIGYRGDLIFDITKSDGAPYKTVDGNLGCELFGWSPSRNFKQAVFETVEWFANHKGYKL